MMEYPGIAIALDEWCGGGIEKWREVLRDMTFACTQDPDLLRALVNHLKRAARRDAGDR